MEKPIKYLFIYTLFLLSSYFYSFYNDLLFDLNKNKNNNKNNNKASSDNATQYNDKWDKNILGEKQNYGCFLTWKH